MPITVCVHCSTPTHNHDGRCGNCGHYAAQTGAECECPDCGPKAGDDRPTAPLHEPEEWDWRSRAAALQRL